MADVRRALRGWERHLEEIIGVDDAAALVDGFDQHVTNDDLDRAVCSSEERLRVEIEEAEQRLRGEIVAVDARVRQLQTVVEPRGDGRAAAWRKDLLVHASGQFFAPVAAVAALALLL